MTANELAVYHGIFACPRDAGLVAGHVQSVQGCDPDGHIIVHRAVHGFRDIMPTIPEWETLGIQQCEVGTVGGRDNLPLLTYGMMEHALANPGWTHLLKTDCNVEVLYIDWNRVASRDYAGCVSNGRVTRCYLPEEREPILREPWRGKAPKLWCYGSAYVVSRKLAQFVVAHGAWEARGYAHEDVMVACIAEEAGYTPVPAITYRDEYGVHASEI